ncbi:hypothetical protein KOR42_34350 [Thalassoglobus neptunius]|uniref:Uncharacterized protein n=1 Tax=Thalassoglobus neptunius TaxID=1938619 RepID=A0A5C5WMA4_9PLAN|nr:hypothetical protein [Thalassoglobus neptunius]TWT51748.1 hypothetical protein KOR42_34350 [Thalassoglobus neptunius]
MTQSEEPEKYPTNRKLADGIPEPPPASSRSMPPPPDDDSDPLQDQYLEWIRKEAAELFGSLAENHNDVTSSVSSAYRDFIKQVYSCPVELAKENYKTWAALGRRYIVNQTTVKRWFSGSEASLKNMSMPFAAEDAIFPRGRHVTVNSYAFAFLVLAEQLNQKSDLDSSQVLNNLSKKFEDWATDAKDSLAEGDPREHGRLVEDTSGQHLSRNAYPLFAIDRSHCEKALVLYLVMRTPEWWLAIKSGRIEDEVIAADSISGKANDLFPTGTRWSADQIKALVESYGEIWITMEEALPYEWL